MNLPSRRPGHLYPVFDWGRFTFVYDDQFGYNPIKIAVIRRHQPGFGPYTRHEVRIPRRLHVRRFVNRVKSLRP